MANRATPRKVVDSIQTSDGMYCVDVLQTADGFTLQACRRDEGSWQVISRPGSRHRSREEAIAQARAHIATLE
jgi:hypothetical protein